MTGDREYRGGPDDEVSRAAATTGVDAVGVGPRFMRLLRRQFLVLPRVETAIMQRAHTLLKWARWSSVQAALRTTGSNARLGTSPYSAWRSDCIDACLLIRAVVFPGGDVLRNGA